MSATILVGRFSRHDGDCVNVKMMITLYRHPDAGIK